MAELVDAADSKSVFERSGSSSLPRGTILKKTLKFKVFFFACRKVGGQQNYRSPPALNLKHTPLWELACLRRRQPQR